MTFFLLRKELARVEGFREWATQVEQQIDADEAHAFFVRLRNFSQKEGRIQVAGHMSSNASGRRSRWRWTFVDGSIELPVTLRGVDVVIACGMHLARTARLVLDCAERFPYHACPWMALSAEGVKSLKIDLDHVQAGLGYPSDFIAAASGGDENQRRMILQRLVDPVDFGEIERLSRIAPN